MENWMWRAIQAVAFVCAAYLPLQVWAIYRQTSWARRIAAGLPLVVMLPFTVGLCTPGAWQDGSLQGMNAMCLFYPSLFWAIAGCLSSDGKCPECGKRLPSFALTRAGLACRHCPKR